MAVRLKKLGADRISGVLTVILVAAMALYVMSGAESVPRLNMALSAGLYTLYILLFWGATQEHSDRLKVHHRWAMLALQYALVLALFYLVPFSPNGILLVIWSAQLPYFFSFKQSLITLPLWSAPPWWVFASTWQADHVLLTAVLYGAFNLFALVMMDSRRQAELQQQRAEQANRELKATQSLLAEAHKQSERTRIARDIHDLVGHHLTALTIHLQTAAHKTQGEARQAVEQSHAIAKLLLADVREAVSDLRADQGINLRHALEQLTQTIPGVEVHLNYRLSAPVTNMDLALTLLRTVQESLTNSIKHGNASEIQVQLFSEGMRLMLIIEDNGTGNTDFTKGHGLAGIEERVMALGGQVTFSGDGTGFSTRLVLETAA
ncbi:Histidine kinase [Saliniradius amylolyticus]|uniref:Histidine kinase n=1 Tax=Saliniradius amylolyticus TaxID=2183582 RepID=A0A2S2E5D0_9ALTE|nr:sensor histidine kinase [Saliniradius amylolyticus]AWL12865.1 Histidine kinase [Saliniradius amylolyticus]